jgi:hypothetical protein
MRQNIDFTDAIRDRVKMLAGYGLTAKQIGNVIGCSGDTIERHCQDDLDEGRDTALATVSATAFQLAISGTCPAMTMFYLKCRGRWREVHTDNDVAPSAEPKVVVIGQQPANG